LNEAAPPRDQSDQPLKHVIARDDRLMGTYDDETVVALLSGGTLKLTDKFWDASLQSWRPLHEFIVGVGRKKSAALFPMLLITAMLFGAGGFFASKHFAKTAVAATANAAPAPANSEDVKTIAALKERVAEMQSALSRQRETEASADAGKTVKILNVEDLKTELAITVQNESANLITTVPVSLTYHALPPLEQRLEKVDEKIADTRRLLTDNDDLAVTAAKLFGELKSTHDALSLPAEKWNDAFLSKIPGKDGWVKFGDPKLTDAGAALKEVADHFSTKINSAIEAERKEAIEQIFGDLQNKMTVVLGLIGARALAAESEHTTFVQRAKQADTDLKKLEATRRELEPKQEQLLAEARKTITRTETVTLTGQFLPGEVKRVVISRAVNSDWGVSATLAQAPVGVR
jgi:hypothetical protein